MKKKYSNAELATWFETKAKTAAGWRRNLLSAQERSRDNTVIGRMFFFSYDPKWKDILPIYDRYPLVFPIEKYPDGFLGLNIHYLNYNERIWLLDTLAQYASNKNMTDRTRLRLSYDTLSDTRRLSSVTKPCIKRYLFGHVRSRLIEVVPQEWDMAAQLPLELFVHKR